MLRRGGLEQPVTTGKLQEESASETKEDGLKLTWIRIPSLFYSRNKRQRAMQRKNENHHLFETENHEYRLCFSRFLDDTLLLLSLLTITSAWQ